MRWDYGSVYKSIRKKQTFESGADLWGLYQSDNFGSFREKSNHSQL